MSTVIALYPAHERQGREDLRGPRVAARRLAAVPATAATETPLRLTRRGRRIVRAAVALTLLLLMAAGILLFNRPAEASSQMQKVQVSYHVVLPGETLWQIAGKVAPGVDRRQTIADLLELNALSTPAVSVGQRIAVPVSATRS